MRYFIFILALLSLALDWYAFQGIKRLTANWKSETSRKLVHRAYWVFFVLFIIPFAFSIYQRFANDVSTPVTQWFINAFFTLIVTKLVFVLVLFLEDIVRVLKALFQVFSKWSRNSRRTAGVWPSRRKFVSQMGLVMASMPFGAFVYGVTKGKYNFTVHRHTLYFEDLPEAFDGFKITQLSDIHAGSLDDLAEVERGIKLAQAQQSDLIVFTGDLVNDQASEILPFRRILSRLKAPYGQYSVLGNHDYGMSHDWESEAAEKANLDQLKQYQSEMGFKLLLDESISIRKDDQSIHLLGVENWGRGFIEKGDLDKALNGVEENSFKILLSHDPSHWEEIVKHHSNKVHLTLSGHTHGMQFGVETPDWKWSPVQYRYAHWAGLKQENEKMHYVNRGFGFIGFTGRVGIWPEITVLELRKGKSKQA